MSAAISHVPKQNLRMKFCFTFLILISSFIAVGQNTFVDRNPKVLEYVKYVNNLTDTTMVVLQNGNFTSKSYDGGSKLTGVFFNNELIKITSWFGLSYGINSCDYYIKDGDLLVVEENFRGYDFNHATKQYDYSQVHIGANGWYVFKSGLLIDAASLGHWRFEDDSIDSEIQLILEFKAYTTLLTKN